MENDTAKVEQLTTTIWYVDKNNEICESFVGFVDLSDTTGLAISDALIGQVESLGLDKMCMVGQGYDGASAMSGAYQGVHARVVSECPQATCVHCFSHSLNLVLSKYMETPEIRAAITAIQNACNCFKTSPQRIHLLEQAIQQFCPEARHTRLKEYCATRWVERHDSVFVFLELYDPLLHVLNNNNELSLSHQITGSGFVVATQILAKVLRLTKDVSVILQSKQLDFVSAIVEVEDVIAAVEQWRSDESGMAYQALFEAAERHYARMESDPEARIPKARLAGRQCDRSNVAADTPKQYYKRAVWYPFLDRVSSELRLRFVGKSKLAMKISHLIASRCINAPFQALEGAVTMYSHLLADGTLACKAEYQWWQRKWQKVPESERPASITKTLSRFDHSVYPNISVLLRICATIPVTTATAKRTFSLVRLLKIYLRSVMGNERFNGLALMAIHKEIPLSYDEVIDEYLLKYNPRMKFA